MEKRKRKWNGEAWIDSGRRNSSVDRINGKCTENVGEVRDDSTRD